MKYALLQNIKAIPYATGETPVVDREGFLSAVLGVDVGVVTGEPTEIKLAVTISHCDTADGAFEPVEDDFKYVGSAADIVEAEKLYNVDIDLLACKQFIKVEAVLAFTGGTNPAATPACALVLGDRSEVPV